MKKPLQRPGTGRLGLAKAYERFVRIRGHPREIALGFALGVFVGFTPTMGLQIVSAIFLAALLRWNKIAAAAGVWITNPLTAPFIYASTYLVGAGLLKLDKPIQLNGAFDFALLLKFMQKAPETLGALTLGGVVLGLPAALAAYYVAFGAVKKYQDKIKDRLRRKGRRLKAKRRNKRPAPSPTDNNSGRHAS